MADDFHDRFEDDACWNCHGEGYVYSCVSEYACVNPEDGCDLCMRRCDVCRPNPASPELRQVLTNALAERERQP